jgi:hypothetical protein
MTHRKLKAETSLTRHFRQGSDGRDHSRRSQTTNAGSKALATGPPILECGETSSVIMDFQEDVQYEDPVTVCGETLVKYHRGWTVEY